MNYKSLIDKCTRYIEEHSSQEITAEDLADLCGYSLYHLSSVFRACFGCSIGRYIQEEKMRMAARKLGEGQKISEVAYECGFDTSSGFTKAFRRQYGVSPSEYRNHSMATEEKESATGRNPMKDLSHPALPVRPEFVKRSGFKVYGYVIPVEESHAQAGKAGFWSQVDFKEFPSYPEDAADYAEISTWINPDKETGKMEYFFGYVTSDPAPSEGFRTLSLLGGDYVIFRLSYYKEGVSEEFLLHIQSVWHYIFDEWFASHPKITFDDSRLCFEKYGQASMEICVPVCQ